MSLSILSLNINGDNYWDTLVTFLKNTDLDILCFQEVTGHDTHSGNLHSMRDCFEELQNIFKDTYNGEQVISQYYASGENAYLSNATFFKKQFSLIQKQTLSLHRNPIKLEQDATNFESLGRSLLHISLQINGRNYSILNTHFAWAKTPIQQPHQTEQGKILLEYIRTVSSPFILCGDFNLSPDQPLIFSLDMFAVNLVKKYGITNTLNPKTHRAKVLMPDGVSVDYIFASRDITVKSLQVVKDVDLSDHLGLKAEFEV